MRTVRLVFIGLLLALPLLCEIYYVSPAGKAENDGTSARPWPSVQFALAAVGGGHTIILRAGEYPGPIYIPKTAAGTAYNRTVIQAEKKWKALIIGSVTHGVYTADGTDYVTFDGLEVAGALDDGIKMNGNFGEVRNCWVHGSGAMGISAHTKNGWVIERNLVEFNGQNPQFHHGLYVDGDSFIIRDNIVRHNSGYGMQVYPAASNGRIENNLVYGHFRKAGLILQSPKQGGNNVVSNNTFADNAAGAISLSNANTETIVNNILVTTGAPPIVMNAASKDVRFSYNLCQPACTFEGEGNLEGDPLFAYPLRGAYYLLASSPAIGNGKKEMAPPADFWGRLRNLDIRPDLGAFCFVPYFSTDASRAAWYSGYSYRFSRNSGQDMPDLWASPE